MPQPLTHPLDARHRFSQLIVLHSQSLLECVLIITVVRENAKRDIPPIYRVHFAVSVPGSVVPPEHRQAVRSHFHAG